MKPCGSDSPKSTLKGRITIKSLDSNPGPGTYNMKGLVGGHGITMGAKPAVRGLVLD